MIVTCPSCSARYKLDDAKITGRGARITCPRCRHVFVVFPSGNTETEGIEEAEDVSEEVSEEIGEEIGENLGEDTGPSLKVVNAPAEARPKSQRSAEALDFRSVGISSWKVKVKIGLVYDFSDIKTLRKYIQDGRVTPEDAISHDGDTWKTIGDIPDLDAYFIEIYEQAESVLDPDTAESVGDDDSPTAIVGMGSLGRNLASEAIRQITEEALNDNSQPGIHHSGDPKPAKPVSRHGEQTPFVDPFAALKDRQRERIQARRAASGKNNKQTKDEQAKQSRLLIGALFLVGFGGIWWTMGQQDPAPSAKTQPVVRPTPPTEDTEVRQKQIAEDLRKQIEAELTPVEEEPEEEEQTQRIAIGPRAADGSIQTPDGRAAPGNGSSSSSTQTTGEALSQTARPLATAQDHVNNAWEAIDRRDWRTAQQACRAAKRMEPMNAKVMMVCGGAQFHQGLLDDAGRELSAAESAGSRDPRLKKYQCLVARDQGDLAGAVGFCRAYLATKPPDALKIQALIDDMISG